ncbi:MAG: CHAT domain-containing protein, partial [Symploca sp. SIO2G7]|nr:CHAT domain-containing protein [Symploca sp. SIO2G7]
MKFNYINFLTGLGITLFATPVAAQSIIPATDGTGTMININGNQVNISGGAFSSDGTNLFHRFGQFGVDTNQIVNFLSNPQIQNILAGVNGGNASIIDGLIQVTGGNSNLYLMNPAGIIFGRNATLNVSADFVATTATGIGLGDSWFNAFGSNDYASLNGNPWQFAFDASPPGAIVNAGNLTVTSQHNVTLLGGTVINNGTINAPGGNINLASVPGTSLVRISQPGHILGLEVELPRDTNGEIIPITPLDLPTLLTNSGTDTGITVNPDYSLQLNNSGVAIPFQIGTTLISGNLDVSSSLGGNINIIGNQIGLIGATINASGIYGGGDIRIGGDKQGNGPIPNANSTYISPDSTIKADAVEVGKGGQIIVFAEEVARILGKLSARGGGDDGDGGFVETSGLWELEIATTPDVGTGEWLIDPYNIEIVPAGNAPVNINPVNPFAATGNNAQIPVNLILDALNGGSSVTLTTSGGGNQAGNIIVNAAINFYNRGADNTLTLEADNDIVINQPIYGDFYSIDSLNLRLMAGGDIDINANISTRGGNFKSDSTNFNSQGIAISTAGRDTVGNINISTTQDITTGTFRAERRSSSTTPSAGSITLNAGGKITALDDIYTRVRDDAKADGGLISITANGDIIITTIQSGTSMGDGGDIIILSREGSITFNGAVLSSFPFDQVGNGGNITLIAPEGIFTKEIVSGVADGNAGNIKLISDNTIKINPGSLAGYLRYYFRNNCNDPCEGVEFNDDGSTTITEEFFHQFPEFFVAQTNGWSLTGVITIEGLTAPQPQIPEPTPPANPPALPPAQPDTTAPTPLPTTPVIADTTAPAPLPPTPVIADTTAPAPLPATQPDTTAPAAPQNISLQDVIDNAIAGTGGNVALSSINWSIIANTLFSGNGGDVNLQAQGDIQTGDQDTLAPEKGDGGDILNTSKYDRVATGNLNASANDGNAGEVYLQALLAIATKNVNTSTITGIGGDVIVISEEGSIQTEAIDARSQTNQDGDINLVAPKGKIITADLLSNYINQIDQQQLEETVELLDESLTVEFTRRFGKASDRILSITDIKKMLGSIATTTGQKPAVIYAIAHPDITIKGEGLSFESSLAVILITPDGKPVVKSIPIEEFSRFQSLIPEFRGEVKNLTEKKWSAAKELYQMLITSIEPDLQAAGIDTLLFSVNDRMRSLPFAALYDGKQFLGEKYQIALIPSVTLTNASYETLQDFPVLAMGSSDFQKFGLDPLPAVPVEVEVITKQLWQGSAFLNQAFTFNNLQTQRQENAYRLIHLATHAKFSDKDAYIQLWDRKLRLDSMRELELYNQPQVELLVLSACETAIGNEEAEMGFAGLAFRTGVKTALASLWEVEDSGTLGLMTEFYSQLSDSKTKAEALQKAQLAMMRGEVRVVDGQLQTSSGSFPLPPDLLKQLEDKDLSHPYYW